MGYPGLNLNSKTAVVIGGTSGIGLTLAKGLAMAGADVIPTGRRLALVREVACEIAKMGKKSMTMECDVSDRTSVEAFCSRILEEFTKVDILVKRRHRPGLTQPLDRDAVAGTERLQHPLAMVVLEEQVSVLPVLFDEQVVCERVDLAI